MSNHNAVCAECNQIVPDKSTGFLMGPAMMFGNVPKLMVPEKKVIVPNEDPSAGLAPFIFCSLECVISRSFGVYFRSIKSEDFPLPLRIANRSWMKSLIKKGRQLLEKTRNLSGKEAGPKGPHLPEGEDG